MSAAAIELADIRKSFELAFTLELLSLQVPRGSIYALIGPNGAGKSTLLNMLMGLGEPERGAIRMLGLGIAEDEVEIKRRTAYVSPDMDYRAWGTVGRATDFVRGFYPDWNSTRCEELQFAFGLQLTDLERFADHVAIINQGKLLASGRMDQLVERYEQVDAQIGRETALAMAGINVIAREGNRVRLLIDRHSMPADGFAQLEIKDAQEVPLTLEELFLTLIRVANGRSGWWPQMSAA